MQCIPISMKWCYVHKMFLVSSSYFLNTIKILTAIITRLKGWHSICGCMKKKTFWSLPFEKMYVWSGHSRCLFSCPRSLPCSARARFTYILLNN